MLYFRESERSHQRSLDEVRKARRGTNVFILTSKGYTGLGWSEVGSWSLS